MWPLAALYVAHVHAIRAVITGCRLALIYNLLRTGKGQAIEPPRYNAEQTRITHLMRVWDTEMEGPSTARRRSLSILRGVNYPDRSGRYASTVASYGFPEHGFGPPRFEIQRFEGVGHSERAGGRSGGEHVLQCPQRRHQGGGAQRAQSLDQPRSI